MASMQIHELPSARGCTYVVPRRDFALALKVGQGFSDEGDLKIAKKFLGVTDEEIEHLGRKVLEALADEPLDPRELKTRLGDAVRSLGAEGKKRGQTTTLPIVLGRLQSQGRIRRLAINGRLDEQRYRYALWSPSPLEDLSMDREEALREMAKRYFQWIGPASATNFQGFSGLGVKAAQDVLAPLGLVPMETGSGLLIFPEDREELMTFKPPADAQIALTAGLDSLLLLRREIRDYIDGRDLEEPILGEVGVSSLGGLQDLPSHAIFDRGRLIGLWEYELSSGTVVWQSWVSESEELRGAIARMQSLIHDQLGDARSFSLDSPDSRQLRIDFLRDAQATRLLRV